MPTSDPPDDEERPSGLPTWRPPSPGSDDQWNGLLRDIDRGEEYAVLRYKYAVDARRLRLLKEVFTAALTEDVRALNALRDRWIFADEE